MWFLSKKYKIEDIQHLSRTLLQERDKYRIAFIDDQNPPLIKAIEKHGFDLTHFQDISNVNEIKKYDIVICDIQGVGKSFGSEFEGGHLIKEIRLNYPLKYLIAYSGKSFDMRYNQFFKLCDNVAMKQTDITDWINYLDSAIKQVSDPIFVWSKAREQFIMNNIPLVVVSEIEKSYVKSISNNNISLFNTKKISSKFNFGNTIATIDAIGTYLQIIIPFLIKSSN